MTFYSLVSEGVVGFTHSFEPIASLGINGMSLAKALMTHPLDGLHFIRLADVETARRQLGGYALSSPRRFLLFTAMALDYSLFAPHHIWAQDFFDGLTKVRDERVSLVQGGVVCHIRCDDAWPVDGRTPHPHYPVAPVRFYEEVALRTGKPLYFLGQWALDPEYAHRLSLIPNAHFLPIQTELEDLRLLVQANEVALSCSTFSWAAAFLRTDYTTVHMPRIGLFDDRICAGYQAIFPRCHVYDYDIGLWRGNSSDRDYMLGGLP